MAISFRKDIFDPPLDLGYDNRFWRGGEVNIVALGFTP